MKQTTTTAFTAILFTIVFTVALCSVCDPGWRFSPHSRKCYKFYSKPSAWAHAEFNCRYVGAHHLSVHSAKENKFAKEIAHDAEAIWLGSAQYHNQSEYEWSDHSNYGDFEGWPGGKRPKFRWGRPCTKMNITNGEWFQSCCRKSVPYICQKDPRPSKIYGNSEENNDDMALLINKNSIISRRWRFVA